MQNIEASWQQGDFEIYEKSWLIENLKAAICLVHGMGEHCGRYQHVAKALTEAGYAVLSYDQIGHGKTKGKRGHTPNFEILLESIRTLIDHARKKYPGTSVYLYGHSMGGNLAINYVLRYRPELAGMIITSPWLNLASPPPKFQLLLAKLMKRMYPAFSDHSKLNVNAISRDKKEVKKYVEDPLVHDLITPGFYFPIHEGGIWALDHASELNIPTLLMHGTGDQITSFDSSAKFARAAGEIATFIPWEGGFHELHNDLEKEKVIQSIVDWLNTQTA